MTRPVGYKLNQLTVREVGRIRPEFVQNPANGVNDFQVGRLVIAANGIGLADTAFLNHLPDGLAVIFHIQPVAHLLTIAIDRQRLAIAGVQDHQRDQLLGELVGTVIIGAVGDGDRQTVGVPYERTR